MSPAPRGERAVEGRLLGRALEIGRVLARHLREARGEDASDATRAHRLRAALEELGPTFAKLGQIASTRADLLPVAYVVELEQLQDRVPPMSEAQVVAVMEGALGVPWEDVFESIEPTPLAAGTIGQVHRATLEGGERVVVKVQRANAEDDILRDLGLLEAFAARVPAGSVLRRIVDVPAIVEHLSSSLRRELDFRLEAANADRMREALAGYPLLGVPRIHHGLTSRRLLVMELIDGVPIREAPAGEGRSAAARQLLESYYRQILEEGFFHADPHPGNMLWSSGRIVFLDLGMVGEVEPSVREQLTLLLLAFWQADAGFLTDVVLSLAGEGTRPGLDVEALRNDLARLVEGLRARSLEEMQLGPVLQQLTEIGIRHDVRLPASLALTGKAIAQMQLATAELDPSLDPFEVASRFLLGGVRRRALGALGPERLFYEAQKARVRAMRAIESLERVTGARPGQRLQVDLRGTESLERAIGRAGRRVSLGLGSGGALLGTAITASSSQAPGWVSVVLGIVGGLMGLWLVADLARRPPR